MTYNIDCACRFVQIDLAHTGYTRVVDRISWLCQAILVKGGETHASERRVLLCLGVSILALGPLVFYQYFFIT
jgi:hypothetical protein